MKDKISMRKFSWESWESWGELGELTESMAAAALSVEDWSSPGIQDCGCGVMQGYTTTVLE